ncbi:hypothetical protein ACFSJU_14900 [Paradesertivirga mongoliensis]|uniref:Uncharacterized protein n=1 Tax=Paradesertivirga mongoliensis TaxID=2100740 RepID=A0ABW4ZQ41_9SPHI|nr:hypothetical protein [Pedobacter mongoliensis]
MHLYPYPNPALETCWQHTEAKKSFRVTGIWGKGFLNNYQVVSYELTPLAGGKVRIVPVEKMNEMIMHETLKLL